MEKLSPNYQLVSLEKGSEYERIRITVKLPLEEGWFERVNMHVLTSSFELLGEPSKLEHKENSEEYAIFETEITLETSALYYYYFSYEVNGNYRTLKKDNNDMSVTKANCFKLSVNFSVPEWAKGAVMYQIFPDRFCKSESFTTPAIPERKLVDWNERVPLGPNEKGEWNTEFYGGNLRGIIEKLDYIKSFSTTIIYLTPICYGQSNHRYDTIDYTRIDPFLGNEEDLRNLCEEAHKRGIYVVLDGVFNHTGNRSIYFDQYGEHGNKGAFNNPSSPYKNFYRQTWHNGVKSYNFWWGHITLPECDTTAEEFLEYITGIGGVIDQWFECGIDGIRLDVADELSDLMIERILTAIKRNKPDGFLMGEQWDNPMRRDRGFLKSGKGMHTIMNYNMVDSLLGYYNYQNETKLDSVINEIFAEYPKGTIDTMMNFTSTHDISRFIEILAANCFNPRKGHNWDLEYENASDFVRYHELMESEYEYGKRKLKSYCTALAFLPGIFSIFYGDEAGLQGLHNLANRAPFPWEKEDKELQTFFRTMLKVRTEHEFLKTAECKIVQITKELFIYERSSEHGQILVVASRSHHGMHPTIPNGYQNSEVVFKVNEDTSKDYIPPYGVIILKK